MHRVHRVGEGDRSRRYQRGIFAQTVACRRFRGDAVFPEHLPAGDARREDRGLREFRLHELRIGPFKHHPGNGESQRLVSVSDDRLDGIVLVVQVFHHAHFLRPLPGENKCFLQLYHLIFIMPPSGALFVFCLRSAPLQHDAAPGQARAEAGENEIIAFLQTAFRHRFVQSDADGRGRRIAVFIYVDIDLSSGTPSFFAVALMMR